MSSLSQALRLAAAMLVMLGFSHSTLIQSPLQSVSLPSSSVRGYRPLPGRQRGDGVRPWWSHTRRLDGRLRSSYAPNTILVNRTPLSSVPSSYEPIGFEGSFSGVYGYPSTAYRLSRPSKTLLLQRFKSGGRPGPDERQLLRNRLLNALAKYRQLKVETDYQLEEQTNPRISVHDRENYNNFYDDFYENVRSEILSDEFNYLLDEDSLQESGRNDREQIAKQSALVYPAFLEYLTLHSLFPNNKILSSLPPKFLAHVQAKLDETENSISSRELENTDFGSLPDWEDNFQGRVQHHGDFSIFPGQGQINSVYDTNDHVEMNSNRDQTTPKMQLPKNPTVNTAHSGPFSSDFITDQENERKLNALRQRISNEEIKTSSTKSLETTMAPVRKDETTFVQLEDLVKGSTRNKDQQSLNGRSRRSVTEKEEAALHAEKCHAHNLRDCGQPAMKKLMKATDMKTKCRVREEFLNCMGEKRFQPCPASASTTEGEPKGKKLSPLEDPLVKDLRKSLRKGLATTCIFGYSRAENATLGT